MSASSRPPFFTGWAGFGQSVNNLVLMEPADRTYGRRPIFYGPLDANHAEDGSEGTIGPASIAWTSLDFVGLYDHAVLGNLLAVMPLERPVTVAPGTTYTTSRKFSFRLSEVGDGASLTWSWVAGSQIGSTSSGAPVIACCNVQLDRGVLSAISGVASLSALPSLEPAVGSGLLWNNGGVICIA